MYDLNPISKTNCCHVVSSGSKGGVRDATPQDPNAFNFMQFLGKFGKNRMLAALPRGKSWIRH